MLARVSGRLLTALSLFTALAITGCKSSSSSPPPAQYPPYGQQPYPNQPYPQAPAPGQPAPVAPAPGQPAAVPAPVLGANAINQIDVAALRSRAQNILAELVAALAPQHQARVQGIPLVVDSTPGEVNAFAACTKEGRAAMAITDGLLEIAAGLARARATDELAGTRKVDEYIRFIAQNQRPQQPIVRPAATFWDPRFDLDSRKVARQDQLFDEEVAFILGHELAHHYLGHLPCTAGVAGLAELAHVLTGAVPAFNQPNELAADVSGTGNVLSAGARRQGYRLTEGGGLLTMQFFMGLDQISPADIFLGFERSHPAPQIRQPVITQTANTWRAYGGRLPFPIF
jgi:Zn-dependent protease with chaperone function